MTMVLPRFRVGTLVRPSVSKCFSSKVLDFNEYVARVGPTLQPPVANKLLFGDGFLKVMIVGGPNVRKDYHLQAGEEFFWQIKGDLTLNVVLNGRFEKIHVPEGYCYLLPSHIPHSPQRGPNSMGIVVERGHEHDTSELDRVRWYENDENVGGLAAIDDGGQINKQLEEDNDKNKHVKVLYEEYFHCKDLGTELAPVIKRFQTLQSNHNQNNLDIIETFHNKNNEILENVLYQQNELKKKSEW